MVKKKTSRQKVKDKANKSASAITEEENASTAAEESLIDAGNGYEQLPQNMKRKMLKQMRFYAKLQDNHQALSAKGAIAKKSGRNRKKSGQTLNNLSSIAEFLPTFSDPKSVVASAKLSCKSRQKLVVNEAKQLAAVLAHAVFHSDPFSAIQQHLENTLGPRINAKVKSERGNKGKSFKKKKKSPKASLIGTVQAMDL